MMIFNIGFYRNGLKIICHTKITKVIDFLYGSHRFVCKILYIEECSLTFFNTSLRAITKSSFLMKIKRLTSK